MLMREGTLLGEAAVMAVGVMVVGTLGVMSFLKNVLCYLRR